MDEETIIMMKKQADDEEEEYLMDKAIKMSNKNEIDHHLEIAESLNPEYFYKRILDICKEVSK